MSKDDITVRNMARRYVEWMTKARENPLPKVIQPAAAKAAEFLSRRPLDEAHRQDQEIAENSRRIAEAQRQLAPRDGGEIDDPAVRQPIQMEREFTDDKEKEAYIERIRRAQQNAKK